MTNIEKLARLIVRTGHADKIMSALALAVEVGAQSDHVRSERPELGIRQVAAGSNPAGLDEQVS